jgi:hypothetical protein
VYSPKHKLLPDTYEVKLLKIYAHLLHVSVVEVTWEISSMDAFEWSWWEERRFSCRGDIRENCQMNSPAKFAMEPFLGATIKW